MFFCLFKPTADDGVCMTVSKLAREELLKSTASNSARGSIVFIAWTRRGGGGEGMGLPLVGITLATAF